MEQTYMLSILYCLYYACWCPGHLRSQGISKHGIDHESRNILSAASEELIAVLKGWMMAAVMCVNFLFYGLNYFEEYIICIHTSNSVSTLRWCRSHEVAEIFPGATEGPVSTKPLPEPMLTYHQMCSVAFTLERFHKKFAITWSITYVWRLHFKKYYRYHIFQGSMS